MDDAFIRDRALMTAQNALGSSASVEDILAAADKVHAWLKQDAAKASAPQPDPAKAEHESVAAVGSVK